MNRWFGWLEVPKPGRRHLLGVSTLLLPKPDLTQTLTSLELRLPLALSGNKSHHWKKESRSRTYIRMTQFLFGIRVTPCSFESIP